MSISVFDLFSIGIGPSSSHTMGPMRAAKAFVLELESSGVLTDVARIRVDLYGSLGATGRGHGTDTAVLLGLEGEQAETVDVDKVHERIDGIRAKGSLNLLGVHSIKFSEETDLFLRLDKTLEYHSNGMTYSALDASGKVLRESTFYSIGGGFVVTEEEASAPKISLGEHVELPHPFRSGDELLRLCKQHDISISSLMMANEKVWRSEEEIREGLLNIWQVMRECVDRGCHQTGILPGGLQVKRRAASLYQALASRPEASLKDPLSIMDWVNVYAIAVNEENASGGRVVTAPTNGAAGIVPAVLHYYDRFVPNSNEDGIVRFFLTAGAIGMLFKMNASISGAEVGCQGEVGSACSMAAAGLAEVTGCSPAHVTNAAEIAMEHNLGLTCDPIGGLVQVPCIERNAMASIKAINAVRLASKGTGEHFVSLDKVIRTMRDTGADMQTKYKETSLGGLAVNITEC